MELHPFDASHRDLLQELQQQDDVWEFIGTLPLSAYERDNHVFVIVDDDEALGLAGLFKSRAAGGDDFELVCAMRSEAQNRGLATRACEQVLAWGLETLKLPRVIACIDASNHLARGIATRIGMTELGPAGPERIVYAKLGDEAA